MISCKNCGGLNSEGSIVCGSCGNSLIDSQNNDINQTTTNSINNTQQQLNQNSINSNQENNENQNNSQTSNLNNEQNNNQINTQVLNNYDDEALINAYIGKNAEKIKNIKFNIWMLLFGALYAWYRKMTKVFVILVTVNIAISNLTSIIGNVSSKTKILLYIVNIIPSIVFAIEFKQFYLKDVNVKINKIKKDNPAKTQGELLAICEKKGGITKLPIAFGIISFIVIIAFSIYSSLSLIPKTYEVDGLNISLPKQMEVSSANVEKPNMWSSSDDMDESCSVSVYVQDSSIYSSPEQYISKVIKHGASKELDAELNKKYGLNFDLYSDETYSNIEKLTINSEVWTTITVTSSYGTITHDYLIVKNGKLYDVTFMTNNRNKSNGACTTAHDVAVKSLNFV